MFALCGSDDVFVLGTEGLWLRSSAVTVEIFQALSWICSFLFWNAGRVQDSFVEKKIEKKNEKKIGRKKKKKEKKRWNDLSKVI